MTVLSFEWVGWMFTTTLVFWATPARFRFGVLAVVTALFLGLVEPPSLVALAVLTGVTHVLTRGPSVDGRRVVLTIVPLAGILFGYKLVSVSSGDDLVRDTVIPLGLSYYTLRCIHYVIERYKGSIDDVAAVDTAGYLFFLPTLFVGPIHRFPAWKRDKARHRWDGPLFAEGLERILVGYVKIAFLANFLVSDVFAQWSQRWTESGTASALYLEMVGIGLNLYFQFSGFSDIAIGFARMLGFRVMENFNWPFLARNISEFWNRWHISLTSWSREYVYSTAISLTRSPAVGVMASLMAIALWHEASPRYLLWGLYHGLGIVIWQASQSIWKRLPRIENSLVAGVGQGAGVVTTVHFVFLGFLLVRQPDLASMVSTVDTLLTAW